MKDPVTKNAVTSVLLAGVAMFLCFFSSGLLPAVAVVVLCLLSFRKVKQAKDDGYQGPFLYYALILDVICLVILLRWQIALAMNK